MNKITFKNNDFFKVTKILEKYCEYHHTSYSLGYVSVKVFKLNEYDGKFGKGFTLHQHAGESSRYYHLTYYILKPQCKSIEVWKELGDLYNE